MFDCENIAVNFETQCRGFVVNGCSIGRGITASVGAHSISVMGNSRGIVLRDFSINGVGSISTAFHVLVSGEESEVVAENFKIQSGVSDFFLDRSAGTLEFGGVQYSTLKSVTLRYTIPANANNVKAYLPKGIYKKLYVWIDSTTDLGIVYLIPGGDIVSSLSAGHTIDIGKPICALGDVSEYPFNVTEDKYLWFFSPSYAGGTIKIVAEYWPSSVDDGLPNWF